VASDDVLERSVWIHRYGDGRPAFSKASLAVERPGRLRWLTGSRESGGHWDAYEHPKGISLIDWVQQQGRLSWKEMRRILTTVAGELEQRDMETFRAPLSAQHVWIDLSGDAKLLDFPAQPVESGMSFNEGPTFLHHLALFGLEGRLVSADQLSSIVPRVPMPDYVRPVIAQMVSHAPLQEVGLSLRELDSKPPVVTRARRLVAVLGGASIPIFGFLPVVFLLLSFWALGKTPIGELMRVSFDLADMDSASARGRQPLPGEQEAYEIVAAANYMQIKDTQMATGLPPNLKHVWMRH
jgi:hypothetical protein